MPEITRTINPATTSVGMPRWPGRRSSLPVPLPVLLLVAVLVAVLMAAITLVAVLPQPASAARYGPTLEGGQSLRSGDELLSVSGRYRLVMQADGNAVLYAEASRVLWASGTAGQPGSRLVMQGDGNLVVYTSAGTAAWNSRTVGSAGRLSMQDDGNLVLYHGSVARWWSGVDPGPSSIPAGTTLQPGQGMRSADGRYRLIMQSDGNLVAYLGSSPRWSTGTAGSPGSRMVLQGDGNLVVYSSAGRARWASMTSGSGHRLALQSDGNLVLYQGNGLPTWNRWLRFSGTIRVLSAAEQSRMTGVTWRAGCPTPLSRLRYVALVHWDFTGQPRQGALVVRADVAADVVAVFARLYEARYPIRAMVPIEAFGGNDDASMAADNTSSFNCRNIAGGSTWSRHAYGLAIDINPLENPYISNGVVSPPAGAAYVDRNGNHPALLRSSSVAVSEFEARGWRWGGRWTSPKDYQHFDKSP